MKPLICFLFLFVGIRTVKAQDTLPDHSLPPKAAFTQAYDHNQNASARTTAWTLLGCGAVMTLTGYWICYDQRDVQINHLSAPFGGVVLTVSGALCMLGSIPAFLVARHYRRPEHSNN